MNIWLIEHPDYDNDHEEWTKWRYTYQGGKDFVKQYLTQFSKKEDSDDFNNRLTISYCPGFSKAAVNDIKNSIYQRLVDITRVGGPISYQDNVNDNVDLQGSSMNFFIGTKVLPELLPMRKVGVFVDMPRVNPDSNGQVPLVERSNYHPYLYIYKIEDIKCWNYDTYPNNNQVKDVLLRSCEYQYDESTGLPIGTIEVLKHFQLIVNENTGNRQVKVSIYGEMETDQNVPIDDQSPISEIILNIPRIPFVIFELPHSLLKDSADYQIALLNLASSDLAYALRSNFPFYTEQFDPRAQSPHLKDNNENQELSLNTTDGRKYPVGTERPSFIHPSPEPLYASMEKQKQLKEEIRQLVNLSVSELSPKMASAESKGFDQQSLEAGLSAIGLVLENGERQIAEIWSLYENGSVENVATVKYPEKYNLKSDAERRNDCEQLDKLIDTVPSKTFQKEVCKQISNILLRNRISDDTLYIIEKEIDKAPIINVDPKTILDSVEKGLLGKETASTSLGFPEGEVKKAQEEQAERLKLIAISQTQGAAAARGVPDMSPDGNSMGSGSKIEKQASQKELNREPEKIKTRGEAK